MIYHLHGSLKLLLAIYTECFDEWVVSHTYIQYLTWMHMIKKGFKNHSLPFSVSINTQMIWRVCALGHIEKRPHSLFHVVHLLSPDSVYQTPGLITNAWNLQVPADRELGFLWPKIWLSFTVADIPQ